MCPKTGKLNVKSKKYDEQLNFTSFSIKNKLSEISQKFKELKF